jgi:hypothetical protein
MIFASCVYQTILNQFNRWIYRRSIVVDGNFSMEHMRMKKSEDDVFLSDGEGYMVQWEPYKQHLDASVEAKQVCASPCHATPITLINDLLSVQHVQITKLSIKPTQTGRILMPLVLVHVPVPGMGVLFPILWWIFKKANGIHGHVFLQI